MCIYSCVQTYNSQNNSILPSLKPNIFMPNVLQPKTQLLCLHFVFLFLGTKFLEHFKPKVGASGSFVSGGTRKILQRQRALSCWSEQSRQRCWGWKSGVPGASFTGIREQFIHSRLWIYWFGHSFCQGDCKDGHTPHTHRLPSVKPEFILCQNIPRAGNPSLPGFKSIAKLPETCLLLFIRGLQQIKPVTKQLLIAATAVWLQGRAAVARLEMLLLFSHSLDWRDTDCHQWGLFHGLYNIVEGSSQY